jgi:exodeoxyribonuclease V alpha subunit
VGCFGPRPWQATLDQAQTLLKDLSLDPALGAVAHRVAQLAPPEARFRAFWILLALLVSESEGHSRVEVENPAWPRPLAEALDQALDAPLGEILRSAELEGLVGTSGRPLILEGRWLSSQRLHAAEGRVAEVVRARLGQGAQIGGAPEAVLNHPVALNGDQRRAVALAMGSPLTLITGRPGTGKTSIVLALLRSLQRQEPPLALDRILLAAPTGKAAQRLGEALRQGLAGLQSPNALDEALRRKAPEPMTLHRALGYHPGLGGFRQDAQNPLPADFVIVDEASMIGLELLEGLLEALAPQARLVLLGDADQLPSVEPGAAFRELVANLPEATATLGESYRMDPRNAKGRHILLQAERIHTPALAPELWGAEGIRQGTLDEASGQGGVWLVAPPSPRGRWMAGFLARWRRERICGDAGVPAWQSRILAPLQHSAKGWDEADLARALALLAHFDGFRLLCPVNEGADLGGVAPINQYLHSLALEEAGDTLDWQPRFVAGEPVLVRSNDPRRGLFNGDQGLVLPVQRGDTPTHLEALFPRGDSLAGFPLPSLQDNLDHAYAMTVHKAQGSEFRAVALVLPPAEHPALTREVLYTALTRAREEVLLLGTPEAVDAACARSVARRSGLAQRLSAGSR